MRLAFQNRASLGRQSRVFLIAAAKHRNFGTRCQSRFSPLLPILETGVVDDFIAQATEEIGREPGSCLAHGQIPVCQQEHFRTLSCLLLIGFGFQTQFFKSFRAPVRTNRLEAAFVLALRFGIPLGIARESRHGNMIHFRLVQIRILVDPGQHRLALGKVGIALGRASFHGIGHGTRLDASRKAAFLLGFEEAFPCLLRQVQCQVFHIIRTGRRIDDTVEERFFLQDYLLVTGNPGRELVGGTEGFRKVGDADGVGTADSRAHGLGSGTQHIHIGVIDRFVPERGAGMDERHFAFFFLGFEAVHHIAPQQTHGPELGNFHEIIRPDRQHQGSTRCQGVDIQSLVGQFGEIVAGPIEREAHLFHVVRSGIVQGSGIDCQQTEFRQLAGILLEKLYCFLDIGIERTIKTPMQQGVMERIEINRTGHLVGRNLLLVQIFHKKAEGLGVIGRTDEMDAGPGRVDALQELFHFFYRRQLANVETYRIGPFGGSLSGQSVAGGNVFKTEVLTDFPVVGLAVMTAHIRKIARPGIEVFYMFQIFLAVEGVHVKAFGRFPYEFLVEIGPFEVLDNHIHPFLS